MLYVVPTPIGNLDDITIRAKNILSQSHFIICEDPRETNKLLELLEIRGVQKYIQIIRSHNFNYTEIDKVLSEALKHDLSVSLVTDAGTPVISDPGYQVLQMTQEKGIEYTVLPGATSIIPAAVASGFVSKEFTYLGFLPIKKGRQKTWETIIRSQYPTVILESVHRMKKLVEEIKNKLNPERRIFIGRELTKKFEQYVVTSAGEMSESHFTQKGEFVIVIDKDE